MNFFVTGIDTDSGKTLASAILCEFLQADYWKPIQAGLPRDTDTVESLISNSKTFFHPEHYLLKMPASPHASAKAEGKTLNISDVKVPITDNHLIIEGAGGCLVPINDQDFVIDLAATFNCSVILVADLYLGSINHTLLTANLLQQKKLNVKGIVFNGQPNPESESIILHHTKFKKLLHILPEKTINQHTVKKYVGDLKINWAD
ncbi:dethiobiotin synthase [Chryseotalea sanaruensis]|uniref:ATP-dependent dethiobiotin synthetase BioD n=1 Tax=Chryseotalea sanaruensis TaxID=2482724 RepID=A0A401UFI8_9BACT|nr:dethiobiotin synthase [Chryseotalea sanaruensis]GCC53688.1 dethiobiotin synthase [Chryseotalea sanaruensis]